MIYSAVARLCAAATRQLQSIALRPLRGLIRGLLIAGLASPCANIAVAQPEKSDQRLVMQSAEIPPRRLDLETAVGWALSHNFAIQRAEARLDERVGVRIHADRPTPTNPLVEFSTARREAPDDTSQDISVRLAQEFWIAGQGGLMEDAAEARVRGARGELGFLRTSIAARTRRAFLRLLVAQDAVDTAERAVALAAALVGYAERRLAAGEETVLTLNTAQIARGRAQVRLATAERDKRRAELVLLELLATDLDYEIELEGRLAMPRIEVPSTIRLLEAAVGRRGDLAAAAEEVIAAREELRLGRRQIIPNLTVFGLYEQEEGADIVGGGLAMRLPVLHRYGGERAQARARLRQSQIRRDALVLAVRAEVLQALSDYRRAREAASAVGESMLAKAEENVKLLQKALEAGKVGEPAITAAQDNLLNVRRDYLDAQRDLIDAATALERATGGLIHVSPATASGRSPSSQEDN